MPIYFEKSEALTEPTWSATVVYTLTVSPSVVAARKGGLNETTFWRSEVSPEEKETMLHHINDFTCQVITDFGKVNTEKRRRDLMTSNSKLRENLLPKLISIIEKNVREKSENVPNPGFVVQISRRQFIKKFTDDLDAWALDSANPPTEDQGSYNQLEPEYPQDDGEWSYQPETAYETF